MIWVFIFSWGNGNEKAKYLTFEEVCLKEGSKVITAEKQNLQI